MTTPTKQSVHGIQLRPRKIIKPMVVVQAHTAEGREKVINSARKVINQHRSVLVALKDR